MKKGKIKSYVIAIIIPLLVGGLSALITGGSMDIYETFEKPSLAPPAIVFPIVWTVLFILMGVSSALVFNSKSATEAERNNALIIYAFQLLVNFFWSIIFFNFQAFLFAFVWILLLWALIILMIFKFYKINKTAALLQIPYFLWVTFAAYLTLTVYFLNR